MVFARPSRRPCSGWAEETLKAANRTFDSPRSDRAVLVDATAKSQLTKLLLDAQAIAHVGHWDLNLRSGVLHWSDEMLKIMGASKDSPWLRKPVGVWGFVHPSDRVQLRQAAATAEKQRQPYHAQYRIIRRVGGVRWVEVIGRFEYDADGKATRHFGTICDKTDAKRSEVKAHAAALTSEFNVPTKVSIGLLRVTAPA